jgi:hypothetical protein
MTRSWAGQAGQGLAALGGLLCALAGLRLMTVAVGWAAEARAPVEVPEARVAPGSAPARSRSAAHAAIAAEDRVEAPTAEPLRVMLSVSAGAPRSEVYVNGALLGLSPFLGDFTCKRGEKLKVEIVPKANRPLLERRAVCEGKTLRIED